MFLEPSHGGEHPGHAQHPGGADQQDREQPGHHQRRDEGGGQGPDWDGEMVRTVRLSLEQVRLYSEELDIPHNNISCLVWYLI